METTFVRKQGVARGNFSDFPPSQLETLSVRKGKKMEFIVTKDRDGKTHNLGTEEVGFLQEQNPGVAILVNDRGEIAEVGQSCHLNPAMTIGREESILIVL